MIISRTPFRISFFGGGTDYPAWYNSQQGAVLCTSINKYAYISCRRLPPFFEHKMRVVWSKIECVKERSEIQHPAVREVLRFLDMSDGLEIHHDGDLPARSGLGSSSTFTVGLLHALYGYKGVMPSKMQLALDAIHVEQEMIKENVGSQDQIIAAIGGFNRITFETGHAIHATPITCSKDRIGALENHLMLVFTGLSRNASEIAEAQIRSTPQNGSSLTTMLHMVDEAVNILGSSVDICEFGKLLHESWLLKRSLTSRISTAAIDAIYNDARRAGAIGGKLLGAGGGGFMLLFVPPARHAAVTEKLNGLLHVPFRFENSGSQIIFYAPDVFEGAESARRGSAETVQLAPNVGV